MKFYYYDKDNIYRLLDIHLTHRPHIGEYIKHYQKLFIISTITHVINEHGHLEIELDECKPW